MKIFTTRPWEGCIVSTLFIGKLGRFVFGSAGNVPGKNILYCPLQPSLPRPLTPLDATCYIGKWNSFNNTGQYHTGPFCRFAFALAANVYSSSASLACALQKKMGTSTQSCLFFLCASISHVVSGEKRLTWLVQVYPAQQTWAGESHLPLGASPGPWATRPRSPCSSSTLTRRGNCGKNKRWPLLIWTNFAAALWCRWISSLSLWQIWRKVEFSTRNFFHVTQLQFRWFPLG